MPPKPTDAKQEKAAAQISAIMWESLQVFSEKERALRLKQIHQIVSRKD
jgi:hypothetical protein